MTDTEVLESLSHEDLCEVTLGSLTRLLRADPLLSDLPAGVTIEEVNSQIAVAQGQSITLEILRNSEPSLYVVVSKHKILEELERSRFGHISLNTLNPG